MTLDVPDDLWAVVEPLLPPEPPKPKGGRPRAPDRAALELAARLSIIDEDTGPTFVLEGRIVTMTSEGVVEGRLAVSRGRIAAIVPAGLERGVVVNRTAETVIRLLPPLVITEQELDEGLGRLDAALGALGAEA